MTMEGINYKINYTLKTQSMLSKFTTEELLTELSKRNDVYIQKVYNSKYVQEKGGLRKEHADLFIKWLCETNFSTALNTKVMLKAAILKWAKELVRLMCDCMKHSKELKAKILSYTLEEEIPLSDTILDHFHGIFYDSRNDLFIATIPPHSLQCPVYVGHPNFLAILQLLINFKNI
jgi:hypothetical protein